MTDLLHGDKSTTLPHASPKSDKTRRRFLMFGAGAASAAAAAPVLAATPPGLVETAEAKPQSKGYQETEHVRNYYATTRI